MATRTLASPLGSTPEKPKRPLWFVSLNHGHNSNRAQSPNHPNPTPHTLHPPIHQTTQPRNTQPDTQHPDTRPITQPMARGGEGGRTSPGQEGRGWRTPCRRGGRGERPTIGEEWSVNRRQRGVRQPTTERRGGERGGANHHHTGRWREFILMSIHFLPKWRRQLKKAPPSKGRRGRSSLLLSGGAIPSPPWGEGAFSLLGGANVPPLLCWVVPVPLFPQKT